MDIITIELFDLTVSQAVFEVQRVIDTHPGSAIRIVLDEEMHKVNVIKLLEKQGRQTSINIQGQVVTIDVKSEKRPTFLPPAVVIPAEPKSLPIPPVMILSSSIGTSDYMQGQRLLIEILRRADKQIPWIGLAHDGIAILRDPNGQKVLKDLVGAGVSIRISRESAMFYPDETSGFEVIEDSEWQTLLLKGNVTRF